MTAAQGRGGTMARAITKQRWKKKLQKSDGKSNDEAVAVAGKIT